MFWKKSSDRNWKKAIVKQSIEELDTLYQKIGLSSKETEKYLYKALYHSYWKTSLWLLKKTNLNINALAKTGEWMGCSLFLIAAMKNAPDEIISAFLDKGGKAFEMYHLDLSYSPFYQLWLNQRFNLLSDCLKKESNSDNTMSFFSYFLSNMKDESTRKVVLLFLNDSNFSLMDKGEDGNFNLWFKFAKSILNYPEISFENAKEIIIKMKEKGSSDFYIKNNCSPLIEIVTCGSIAVFNFWKEHHQDENFISVSSNKLLLNLLNIFQTGHEFSIDYCWAISSNIKDWVAVDEELDDSPLARAYRHHSDVYHFVLNFIEIEQEKYQLQKNIPLKGKRL